VVLRQSEWCEDCPEFPWPQIRSALADLVRIGDLDFLGKGDTRAGAPIHSGAPIH